MSEMFVENKYKRWHDAILEKRRDEGPAEEGEWHHALPKSLGGADGEVLKLTFREHFLVHWLLTKFTVGEAKRKMCFALRAMTRKGGKRNISSWQFEIARRNQRLALVGIKRPESGPKISASLKGRIRSEEHCRKLSEAAKKRPPIMLTAQSKEKISRSKLGKKRPGLWNEESKAKMAASVSHYWSTRTRQAPNKGKASPQDICVHCGTRGGKAPMARWHGDNCKMKRIST